MKILHTADWHLGRKLHGVDLLEHQRNMLNHIAQLCSDHQVDVVVVAGDVYDRALPAVDAVSVLDHGVDAILATGAQVVMTAGNHDSATRLGFGKTRNAAAGLHLAGTWQDALTPWTHTDQGHTFAIYPISYLDPYLVAEQLGVGRNHPDVLAEICTRISADAHDQNLDHCTVMAHAVVTGANVSDSERDIAIGGVADVSPTSFAAFDYVALGHLHGPAQITPTIRYSGSPLPYSFSERHHTKGFWLIDARPGDTDEVTFLPSEHTLSLHALCGELSELLADPAHQPAEAGYCHITLTDQVRPNDAMAQLRTRFPNTLVLQHEPPTRRNQPTRYTDRTRHADDNTLCHRFIEHVRGAEPNPAETQLITTGWQAVHQQQQEP